MEDNNSDIETFYDADFEDENNGAIPQIRLCGMGPAVWNCEHNSESGGIPMGPCDAEARLGASWRGQEDIINMQNTKWFKTMRIYPTTYHELYFFVNQMDTIDIFGDYELAKILKLSAGRLDSFYALLRYINHFSVEFCETAIRILIDEFNPIFLGATKDVGENMKMSAVAFLNEYYIDTAWFMMRLITPSDKIMSQYLNNDSDNKIPEDLVTKIAEAMSRYCYRQMMDKYYRKITKKLGILMDKTFFDNNLFVFVGFAQKILEYICSTAKTKVTTICKIYKKFIDTSVEDEYVEKLISDFFDPLALLDYDNDAINYFEIMVMDNLTDEQLMDINTTMGVWEYENFLYPYQYKFQLNEYAFWSKITHSKNTGELAKKWAEQNNLSLCHQEPVHNILDVFVTTKLVGSTEELISMVASMMETFRNAPFIFNKHNEIDLENSFTMIALSNDLNQTYDSFLEHIKQNSKLPSEYLIEFILRLVSRILNVNINFFPPGSKNMNDCIYIDNSNYQKYEDIIIYQESIFEYYACHPINKPFGTKFETENICGTDVIQI